MRTTKPEIDIKESKSSKRLRITIAALYFIEVLLTTFPFMWGGASDGKLHVLTAFEMVIQPSGYNSAQEIRLALYFSLFIILPIVSFFFMLCDKKSNVKNFVSVASCIICCCLITFGLGNAIAIGALMSMLLYILILFLTVVCIFSVVKEQ